VDFQVANQLADRVSRGENGGLYQMLVKMCIPYLLGVKHRYGFCRVTYQAVVGELAPAAVSDSISLRERLGRPFMACLQNIFRDRCREADRAARQEAIRRAIKDCEIPYLPRTIGAYRENPPDEEAAKKEELQMIRDELSKHEKGSRTAVAGRARGSPYKEIATLLGKTAQQCRALHRHDVSLIRDHIGHHFATNKDR